MANIQTKCPNPKCNTVGQVPEQYLGRTVKCQQCGKSFTITAHQASGDAPPASRQAGPVLRAWQPGEIILDDYLVERTLGEGSLGAVYLLARTQPDGARFAVKQVKLADPAIRRSFPQMLQLWLDLPAYPHLTASCFYRAVDDGVLLFNEYYDSEPLSAWITQRKLNQLPDLLDVAIQCAWGLHAVHHQGLVHLHMKPGNVLLTPERTVKVNDAWQTLSTASGKKAITTDYCSPEQAAGQQLTRASDVWSWAVCVLEMFTGEVAWLSGAQAGETLEGYLAYPPDDSDLPAMPATLAELLRLCFRADPKTRPGTLLSIAEALVRIYAKEIGQAYPRTLPAFPRRAAQAAFADGVTHTNPRTWLESALLSSGRDPREADTLFPANAETPAGAEPDMLAKACSIYEELLQHGRNDLEVKYAGLCLEVAGAREQAADAAGALPLYDRCLPIYERLVLQEKRREAEPVLAAIYRSKGCVLQQQGNLADALGLFDRCIILFEHLVQEEGRKELAPELAAVYLRKHDVLKLQGDCAGAESLYDRCIPLFERLVLEQGRRDLEPELAVFYLLKGCTLEAQDDQDGALELYTRCIAIREQLVYQEARHEVEPELAAVYITKADVLQGQSELAKAVELYDRGISLYERLVREQEKRACETDLAMAYLNKGIAMENQGDLEAAVHMYDQCCALNEQLVQVEQRSDCNAEWAKAQLYAADGHRQLGHAERAGQLAHNGMQLLDEEITRTGSKDLQNVRTWAWKNLREVL